MFTQIKHVAKHAHAATRRVSSSPALSFTTRPLLRSSPVASFTSRCSSICNARCFSTDAKPADATATPAADAATASDAAAAAAEAAKTAELLKQKDAQIKDLTDKYQRALAEAQNTLNRSMNQLADSKKFAVQSFAKQLLEVADVLEIAIKAAEPKAAASTDPDFKNLFEGVAMTQKVVLQIFERNGLKKFEPLGEKFDPYFQEGLLQVEDPTKTPGTVAMVLKSGYKLHERCLRAAQVGTVKAPSSQ